MRIAAQVVLVYVLILFISCLWRFIPLGRLAPDLVALFAVYLGLTARRKVAPAILGAVVIGYLADLLIGTPRGMMALTAGVICIMGQLIHRRILVRGMVVTFAVSFVTGLASGLFGLGVCAYAGALADAGRVELGVLAGNALLTGLFGPVVFRLCRIVDARFVRTHYERDTI